ncbi:MAG: hypothetical protein HYZ29_29660 [Myxococcales bacterium]|nr:hypothetical protein [Myxococcales bacterium]
MVTLRIQHSVPTFDSWKRAFDADPVGRKGGGARRYSIHRSVSDPNFVMIDLEFETVVEADAFLEKLRGLWRGAAQAVMLNPQAWVVETVKSTDV